MKCARKIYNMKKIYPVLLAGGLGDRLWPLSRKSYPKQFSTLNGQRTLFQQAAIRLTSSKLIKFAPHVTLTNSDFRFIINEQLLDVDIDRGHILIEPETKNTAPAILAATLFVFAQDPEAVLLVTPSDHVIPDKSAFHAAVELGINQVNMDKIVTFGVSPVRPETGYGYLELELGSQDKNCVSLVKRFVEKPDYARALQMLNSGNYLWNAGIFLFKAKKMLNVFKTLSPKTFELTRKALNSAQYDLNFLRLNSEYWKDLEGISIDFAIMEKIKNLVAVPFMAEWSDLGSWDAVWSKSVKASSGVALSNGAHEIDCRNSIIRSEHSGQQIVGLGLDNIIAVAMPDAVLVASKDKAQDVKKVVDYLKVKNVSQAENFPKGYRPWGWFESLSTGDKFHVKLIHVKQGCVLSLQSHKYRSEHWIVLQGEAKISVDDKVNNLTEGQSAYIPLGAIHRLENIGKTLLVLIEVQTGSYFGEDDIVRYEDLYNRE